MDRDPRPQERDVPSAVSVQAKRETPEFADGGAAMRDLEKFSELIGRIYDCAIDPDLWPDTTEQICRTIDCVHGVIVALDLRRSQHRFITSWGLSPEWAKRYLGHGDEVTAAYEAVTEAPAHPIDEPIVFSRLTPAVMYREMRIYREWVRPQNLCDFISQIVLREPGRLGVFGRRRLKWFSFAERAELRANVADTLLGDPDVVQHDVDDVLANLAAPDELHRWQTQALLYDLGRRR